MPRILLVDDDDGVREVVEQYLTEAGFDVIPARDTIMGRRQLELNHVDLCLVDMVMPAGVPDGAEFARSVRGEMPEMPVILMTGYYATAVRARAVVSSLLYKPIDLDALVTEIERHLPR
jgi:DNA-binding NtrC family response regulator